MLTIHVTRPYHARLLVQALEALECEQWNIMAHLSGALATDYFSPEDAEPARADVKAYRAELRILRRLRGQLNRAIRAHAKKGAQ